MEKRGSLLVISGFSGVGKGTVAKKLVEKYGYSLSISATTRQPREGEVDGREYFFKTVDDFKNLIDYNGFIEYARYVDNYYGTPRKFVEDELAAGHNVILEIEVQGAFNIKKQYEDALLIFITAPSAAAIKERLVGRGTESEEVINKRLNRAKEESEDMDKYDYIVINDQVEDCADRIHAIVQAKECLLGNNLKFIEATKKRIRTAIGGIIMLHPSYTELMKVINGDSEEEKVISSRYSIVLASAKRARQIIAGDMPLVEEKDGAKPLSTAVEELWEEKVKILGDDEEAEE